MMKNNIGFKETLDKLYKDIYVNGVNVTEANRRIEELLSEAYNLDPLCLFVSRIQNKDCIQNIKRFLNGESINDVELAKAMSSLMTHSLIEMEKNSMFYKSLRIDDQAKLLSDFLNGCASREDVSSFFQNFVK